MPDEYPVVLLTLFASSQIEIQAITDELERGQITLDDWRDEMQHIIARYAAAAMMLGIDSDTLTEQAQNAVKQHIEGQMPYLNGFADDIRSGLSGGWNGQWNQRAEMYGEAVQTQFWTGRMMIDSGNWQWHYDVEAKHCMDCWNLNGQIHSAEWWTQNNLPGDGRTECLTGCRCHLSPV